MRIAIWQQFSSNHSGAFWVAGAFETAKDAAEAHREVRQILNTIADWLYDNRNTEAGKPWWDIVTDAPTPPEIEIAQKYNIEWPTTIDWSGWARYDFTRWKKPIEATRIRQWTFQLSDEAISRVANLVILSNPNETWMTVARFQQLLERLGAQTIGFDAENAGKQNWENRYIRLTCIAPDERVAANLKANWLRDMDIQGTAAIQDERSLVFEFPFRTAIDALFESLQSQKCTEVHIGFFEKD